MSLRCETCGADNPATNRYCGQCGRRLEQTATDTPEEFWRGGAGKHVDASADLPPEVIEFDNRIPLIADSGSDRRLHPPPEISKQVHDHLERESQQHDQLQHGSEPHAEVHAKEEAERLRASRSEYLRWDTNSDVNDGASEVSDRSGGDVPIGSAIQPNAGLPSTQPNFIPEGERTRGTGVSGPSFLGLTDDQAPEYADEEPEPKSHLRRNLALGILAAVMILAALQWRSIRNYGLGYVQNGSMTVKQSMKGAPQNPPAVAAEHNIRDLTPSPATAAKTGAPLPVESSPNAERALPVQPATNSAQPPSSANVHDSPAATVTKPPPARSTPVTDAPRNPQHAGASRSASKQRALHTPPSRAVPRPVGGADEMRRAAAASDAEARAAWLWKAVGKGNPQAPIELAKMYEQGRGVVRSCDQAQVLLRSAAAKGNAQAKVNLQQIRARGGCSAR